MTLEEHGVVHLSMWEYIMYCPKDMQPSHILECFQGHPLITVMHGSCIHRVYFQPDECSKKQIEAKFIHKCTLLTTSYYPSVLYWHPSRIWSFILPVFFYFVLYQREIKVWRWSSKSFSSWSSPYAHLPIYWSPEDLRLRYLYFNPPMTQPDLINIDTMGGDTV